MTAPDRRTLLRGVAVAGAAAPLVAACASSSGDSSADSVGASGGASLGPAGEQLVSASDVPVGGGVILTDKKVVVTQPEAGAFKAFSAVCTHQGCIVGLVDQGRIICPCHGSQFSIEDGSVTGGPAPAPLPEGQVTVVNGEVELA